MPDWPIPSAGFAPDQHMTPLFETMVLETERQLDQIVDLVVHRPPRSASAAALIDCIVVVDPPASGW